ncbi:hypothetical protein ATANTOWER_025666 [Ataeniobius toweri]|uniref:Uncharacterized protein n=1 Tax=Ataeniobius toweri TaxID=208326 RepID=A0ABU7A9K0_9TELE|nr:hypothetical protein [Ataeniobius toweri]
MIAPMSVALRLQQRPTTLLSSPTPSQRRLENRTSHQKTQDCNFGDTILTSFISTCHAHQMLTANKVNSTSESFDIVPGSNGRLNFFWEPIAAGKGGDENMAATVFIRVIQDCICSAFLSWINHTVLIKTKYSQTHWLVQTL